MSENPVGENQETPSSERQPDNQASHPKQQILQTSTELEMPPANPQRQDSYAKKKHWLDYATAFMEFVGLVVLCIYAAYTIKIYCANQKAANAAAKAADNAAAQTTLLRQQVIGTVSPILRLGDPPGTGDIQFDINTGILYFEIFNKGHSISPSVTLSATVRFLKIGSGTEISNSSVPITQTWTNFAPSDKPEEGSYQTFSNPSSIRRLLAETNAVAELKGNLSYDNGFGETKVVPFCRFVFGRFNQPGEPAAVTFSCDNGMPFTKAVANFRSTCQQQHWDCPRS